jgi:predicted SprT family Zn-dependent metalloprotease
LPECIQRVIIAHELCHAVNHRHSGVRAFHIFNQTSVMEQDALKFLSPASLAPQPVNGQFPVLTKAFLCCKAGW